MADMTIPVGWTRYDVGPDYVSFRLAGHTSDVPRIAKFKRRPQSGGTSSYQVLGVFGYDGTVSGESRNSLVTLDIRNVAGQDKTDMVTFLGELATLIESAGFQDDALVELDLPLG